MPRLPLLPNREVELQRPQRVEIAQQLAAADTGPRGHLGEQDAPARAMEIPTELELVLADARVAHVVEQPTPQPLVLERERHRSGDRAKDGGVCARRDDRLARRRRRCRDGLAVVAAQ